MSLLSYTDLYRLIGAGVINANPDNVNAASIDITLDDTIALEDNNKGEVIDLQVKQNINMTEWELCEKGFLLKPGHFILASSKETFNLPNHIAAEYKLKSSLARNGLQHMLAGWCDPGWTNSKLTLELHNVTRHHTLLIRPGMKIGQMVFWKCPSVPDEQSYAVKGQYNDQGKVTKSKGVR